MKIYKEEIVTFPKKTVISRKCDLCPAKSKSEEWESKGCYDVNETEISVEIRQKEGESYPEGGSGKKYEIDLCPKCFKTKLIPWLKSQGADIKQEEWDW